MEERYHYVSVNKKGQMKYGGITTMFDVEEYKALMKGPAFFASDVEAVILVKNLTDIEMLFDPRPIEPFNPICIYIK